MEGKVEEAERRRLADIEQRRQQRRGAPSSCGAPAPAPYHDDDEYDYRKMLGSIARESYDDFSLRVYTCVEINQCAGCSIMTRPPRIGRAARVACRFLTVDRARTATRRFVHEPAVKF